MEYYYALIALSYTCLFSLVRKIPKCLSKAEFQPQKKTPEILNINPEILKDWVLKHFSFGCAASTLHIFRGNTKAGSQDDRYHSELLYWGEKEGILQKTLVFCCSACNSMRATHFAYAGLRPRPLLTSFCHIYFWLVGVLPHKDGKMKTSQNVA